MLFRSGSLIKHSISNNGEALSIGKGSFCKQMTDAKNATHNHTQEQRVNLAEPFWQNVNEIPIALKLLTNKKESSGLGRGVQMASCTLWCALDQNH